MGSVFRSRRAIALLLPAVIGACSLTPPTTTVQPKDRQARPSAAPSATPSVAATEPPASPAPQASASPSPQPSASTSPSIAPEAQQLRTRIAEKLLHVAKAGFVMNRNNLLSNNGSSIISNNGVGVISNNAGSLVGNNGSNFRVLQAESPIQSGPLAGEAMYIYSRWPDQTETKSYTQDFAKRFTDYRNIEFSAAGQAVASRESKVLTTWPDGQPKTVENIETQVHTEGAAKGQLKFLMHYFTELDVKGEPTRVYHKPDTTRFRDPASQAAIDYSEMDVDAVAGTGKFKYRYPDLGLVESGTLTGVKANAQGKFILILQDPLGLYDGESRMETTDGTLLFTKKQETVSGKAKRTYDLQGGLTMALERSGPTDFTGTLLEAGATLAQVTMAVRANGTIVFTVAFADAPGTPMTVGYGDMAAQPLEAPEGASPPTYWVDTVVGNGTAGNVDGAGSTARLGKTYQIVRSRVASNKFYIADGNNHRVRVLTIGADKKATIENYAGTGQMGFKDGAAATAQFNSPFGLAVGPDDTLYVAEGNGNKIRKITPDGQVSIFAGNGMDGDTDASGIAARFRSPTGLALDDDGNLFVADMNNHRIRKITPAGVVTTVAGSSAGFADGTGTGAKFNYPIALAFDAAGQLYVADRENYRIRRVAPDGAVSTYAGSGVLEKAFLDGPATEGGIGSPMGLCFGPDGTLFVATWTEVRQVTPDGSQLRTYVAGWEAGAPKDGSNKEALFEGIFGIAPGPDGTLLISDQTRIRRVMPPGYFAPAP